jgi:hypothetical protein
MSIAFTVVIPADAEQLLVQLTSSSGAYTQLQYYGADGPGLYFEFGSDDDLASLELSDGPGTFNGVVSWDPLTGEYRASVSKDWGALELQAGTEPTGISAGDYTDVGFNASIPYVSSVVTETCQVTIYPTAELMSYAEQSDILSEREDVWKPVVLLSVSTTPQVFTDGNWPEAELNGSVPFRIVATPSIPSTDGGWASQPTLLSSDPNGGYWLFDDGSDVQLGVYDTGGGTLCNVTGLSFAAGQTFCIEPNHGAGTLTLSGFTAGNGTYALSPGNSFTIDTSLHVGDYANGGGHPFPGTIHDILEVIP